MRISILGLGYVGLPLARELMKEGHKVSGTTTTEAKLPSLRAEGITAKLLSSPELPDATLLDTDVLVLNIPPSENQPGWFQNWDLTKTGKIIFVSSTGVHRNDGRNSDTLRKEEEWVKSCGKEYVIVRPGGLLGNGRHPGKTLSGKKDLKGRSHPVNLIHVDDVVGFISTLIRENIHQKTFDLVSDEHHTREEFYSDFCRRNQMPLPEFDRTDLSTGPIISNEKVKKYYVLRHPTMIGRSL